MSEPLQDRYAEALVGRSRDRASCPAPEELQRLADRTLNEPERLRLYDHVMACRECHREYALLDSMQADRPRVPGRLLALAAMLVAAAGIGLVWRSRTTSESPALRGDRSVIELLTPGESTLGAPQRFEWSGTGPDARYRFELLRGGVLLFSAEGTDTVLQLPDTVRLSAEVDFTWWVRATRLDGSQAASALRRLRVTR